MRGESDCETSCRNRQGMPCHGESPLSGGGFSGSFFFLSPKIPKIFCNALFFFSGGLGPLGGLTGIGPCRALFASGGGRIRVAGSRAGGFGEPPPKMCERKDPEAVAGPCPPCSSQSCVGSDPATYTSSRVVGQLGVATCRDSGSITVESMPSGFSNGPAFRYPGSLVALIIKSAQIGATATPPVRPKSWLSSKPTQITQTRSVVKPENQPSRDVPVFPAAGRVNPFCRTAAPVPLLSTSCSTLSTR